MSGVHDYLATVLAGLAFECDGISEAIGEGCGECRGCLAYASAKRVEAEVARLEQACNICGKAWPEHHDSCAYLGNVSDKKQAEAEVARLERLTRTYPLDGVFLASRLEAAEADVARLHGERNAALRDYATQFELREAAEAQVARLRDGLRREVAFALPEHGGVCAGTDARPLSKDPRGSFSNPCIRCQVLLAFDRALLAEDDAPGAQDLERLMGEGGAAKVDGRTLQPRPGDPIYDVYGE